MWKQRVTVSLTCLSPRSWPLVTNEKWKVNNSLKRQLVLCHFVNLEIIKVIPKLSITSILYFLYGSKVICRRILPNEVAISQNWKFLISLKCRGFSQFHGPWTQIKIPRKISVNRLWFPLEINQLENNWGQSISSLLSLSHCHLISLRSTDL